MDSKSFIIVFESENDFYMRYAIGEIPKISGKRIVKIFSGNDDVVLTEQAEEYLEKSREKAERGKAIVNKSVWRLKSRTKRIPARDMVKFLDYTGLFGG